MIMVLGSVVLFCGLCMGLGYLGKSVLRKENKNIAAGPQPAVAVSAPAQEPTPAESTPAPRASGTGALASFGDGTWLVGIDVEPGEYRARVPADSPGCNWARLASIDGGSESLLANGTSEPGTQATATISPGDQAFQSQGCGDWERV